MNNPEVLFYFTDSWPYGLGESWKRSELSVLCERFKKIFVVPLWYNGNKVPVEIPSANIQVLDPPFESLDERLFWFDLFKLFRPNVFREVRLQRALFDRRRLAKALTFVKRAYKLRKTVAFEFVLKNTDANTVWYFFWARGWADILPFIKKPMTKKVAIRAHGYDLYLERNNGYIPFRDLLFERADILLPVSEAGRRYLLQKFQVSHKKVVVSRLGTNSRGLSKQGHEELNIVTCCFMVPVKRLDRTVEALKLVENIRVRWVHIGDGPLMNAVRKASESLPANVQAVFVGKLPAEQVLDYYAANEIDLFLNTSESEGVPVSIMEALSASIPVIATNVGGTSEIIDDRVGKLLTETPDPEMIAKALEWYFNLPAPEKSGFRERAYQRYSERCDARKWAEFLASQLS